MSDFEHKLFVHAGVSVLDLGGQPSIWGNVLPKLRITILNLPGAVNVSAATHHEISYIEGDACGVHQYDDAADFDIVFSNSVIEHVGNEAKRRAFAGEVRRLGKAYWVQTPSKYFPIEAHCGMPFWWFYPATVRQAFIERWRKKLPAWVKMVEGTDVVTKSELRKLFPDAQIFTERVFGIPKSYVAFRPERAKVAPMQPERHDGVL